MSFACTVSLPNRAYNGYRNWSTKTVSLFSSWFVSAVRFRQMTGNWDGWPKTHPGCSEVIVWKNSGQNLEIAFCDKGNDGHNLLPLKIGCFGIFPIFRQAQILCHFECRYSITQMTILRGKWWLTTGFRNPCVQTQRTLSSREHYPFPRLQVTTFASAVPWKTPSSNQSLERLTWYRDGSKPLTIWGNDHPSTSYLTKPTVPRFWRK